MSLIVACVGLGILGCVLAGLHLVGKAVGTPGPYARVEQRQTPVVADSAAPGAGGVRATPVAAGGASPAGGEAAAVATAVGGEQVFNTFCVACHQQEGQGKVGFAPFIRNRDFLSLASDDFLRKTIVAGRPGTAMVGWSHLKPHEIDSLILYLRSVEDPDAKRIVTVDPAKKRPGKADAGEGLYAQYCAACHGQNATGYAEGGPGPGIGNAAFLAVASDDYIFHSVKIGRIGTPMKGFSGSSGLANLSDQEIGDIIAYLRSREGVVPVVASGAPDPKAGEMHFNANCVACHQPGGIGRSGFAPSIRNRDFLALASDDFIKQTVRGGRPGTAMVMRPDLSDQVLGDIVAYLRSVPVGTAVDVDVDPGKNLATLGKHDEGQVKFAVYCASCHGNDGTGYVAGGSGPAIGLPGFLNAASDDYIYQTLRIGRLGTAMKPFLGAKGVANLNDQDAHDIIAYLRTLNPAAN